MSTQLSYCVMMLLLSFSFTTFSAILGSYNFFMDDIEEGANNFAEQVMESVDDVELETPNWRSSFSVTSILERVKEEPVLDYGMPLAETAKVRTSLANGSFSDILSRMLKKATQLETYERAPVRGGSLPNRKAQFNSLVLKPPPLNEASCAAATTHSSWEPTYHPPAKKPTPNVSERQYGGRRVNHVVPPSPPKSEDKSQLYITARQQLLVNNQTQGRAGQSDGGSAASANNQIGGLAKKSLGGRGPRTAFVPPFARSNNNTATSNNVPQNLPPAPVSSPGSAPQVVASKDGEIVADERLKQFDAKIIDLIMSEIMDSKAAIKWNDIAGLHSVKSTLKEVVIFPMIRPDLFTGLRGPPKGLLLFGPPGTGKTLIGKCIASTSNSTFFSISASSLTSKWVGDGEKMVRALFTIARIHQPAVIFIDEIDSLLSQRSETEHESSRRIKTEFLVQLDGVNTGAEDRLLLVGATNRPQELDEAARRRFVKRLYVPMPCEEARREIVERLIKQQHHNLTDDDLCSIAAKSDGFSGADVANLCREAAMGPIRGLSMEAIQSIECTDVRPVQMSDFLMAFNHVKASVCPKDLEQYLSWNRQYGSFQV